MRQKTSLFNRACEFINSVPVAKTFTSAEYIASIGKYENVTGWKRYSKNRHYNCHQYKGYLKRAGFISQVKRGTWKVERHIPEWFDLGHLSILLGYYKWDSKSVRYIKNYKGMEKIDIIAQLDEDTHRAMGLIPEKPSEVGIGMRIAKNSTYGSHTYHTDANIDYTVNATAGNKIEITFIDKGKEKAIASNEKVNKAYGKIADMYHRLSIITEMIHDLKEEMLESINSLK